MPSIAGSAGPLTQAPAAALVDGLRSRHALVTGPALLIPAWPNFRLVGSAQGGAASAASVLPAG